MTIALPADSAVQRRTFRIDFSWPVLIAFAALLCVLIVLPMSWLVYYAFVDKAGAFHASTISRRSSPSPNSARRW